jgi:NAD(P)-dependent dehydrogenase (short-subunit alcohol dehydrogenase family)
MTQLAGKSVLVTGGSRGIGANRAAAETVQQEIGTDRCQVLQADLAVPGEVDRLWGEAAGLAGRIDVLVKADLCRAAILHFRDHGGGKIINVASRAAFRGEAPDEMPYGASKGALVTLTKTIARGFAADGVLAFSIATDTEMVTGTMDATAIAAATSDIPLGRMADPEEIGALAAFLCDDRVRHLTGATFDVNGASYVR